MKTQCLHSSLYAAIKAIATIAFLLQTGSANAAVTMVGTRVIYDPGSQGQSLTFNNSSGGPSVIQAWVDSGNEQSTPETADAPFVVTPPIFRIEPGAGQLVRLIFTGKDLPQDRESVFYLNTLEIPSLNAANANQNQLLVMVRSRVKVFYRPSDIPGTPERAAEQLNLRVTGQGKDRKLIAGNDSGYFVSIANGQLECGSHTATLPALMIAPRTEVRLEPVGECPLDVTPLRAQLHFVDDHGAVRDADFSLTTQAAQ